MTVIGVRSSSTVSASPPRKGALGETGLSPPGRAIAVDNLRSLLVAGIIACHALLAYTAIGGWPYDEVNEVTFSSSVELAISVVLGPTALFVIGTFFFLAGLFAPRAMAHQGSQRFARSRILRLGLPWLAFMLTIWPFSMWLAYRSAGHDISFWQAFGRRQPFLDAGPLWFVQVLLYISLAYALWSWRAGSSRPGAAVIRARLLVVAAGGIAAASFVVRLRFPARSQQILDLHLWQWPQCVGMFCLGVFVSRQNWARHVPSAIARRCGIAVVTTVALALTVVAATGITSFSANGAPFLGGWHWQALALDVTEASLVVAGSVWLLSWSQRHLVSQAPLLQRVARGCYAAFILQAPVLISLEIAARPLPFPATGKALLVGLLAVAMSFSLGWLIVERTPLARAL